MPGRAAPLLSSRGQAGLRSGTAEEHLPCKGETVGGNVFLDWSAGAVHAVPGRLWCGRDLTGGLNGRTLLFKSLVADRGARLSGRRSATGNGARPSLTFERATVTPAKSPAGAEGSGEPDAEGCTVGTRRRGAERPLKSMAWGRRSHTSSPACSETACQSLFPLRGLTLSGPRGLWPSRSPRPAPASGARRLRVHAARQLRCPYRTGSVPARS